MWGGGRGGGGGGVAEWAGGAKPDRLPACQPARTQGTARALPCAHAYQSASSRYLSNTSRPRSQLRRGKQQDGVRVCVGGWAGGWRGARMGGRVRGAQCVRAASAPSMLHQPHPRPPSAPTQSPPCAAAAVAAAAAAGAAAPAPQVPAREEARHRVAREVVHPPLLPQLRHDCVNPWGRGREGHAGEGWQVGLVASMTGGAGSSRGGARGGGGRLGRALPQPHGSPLRTPTHPPTHSPGVAGAALLPCRQKLIVVLPGHLQGGRAGGWVGD